MTGVGSGGHGEQILKALTLAGPDKYMLFGADANAGARSKLILDQVYELPLANSLGYIDTVLSLAQKLDVDAIFHGSEPELTALSAEKSRFEQAGIFLATNQQDLVKTAMNKDSITKVLEKLGFSVPRSWFIPEGESIEVVDEFPVVVKPHLGGGGSRDVFIAQDFRELEAIAVLLGFFDRRQSLYVQKYVGSSDSEFTVGVLNSPSGNLIGSVAMKRDLTSTLSVRSRVPNRTADIGLGDFLTISSGVSQGLIDDYPLLRRQCEDIAKSLGSAGPLNIQCRLVGNEVFVFEINPRFSGTTSARALAGFNEPDLFLDSYFYPDNFPDSEGVSAGTLSRSLIEAFEAYTQ